MKTIILGILLLVVAGCSDAKTGAPAPEPGTQEHPAVTEARTELPRFVDLQTQVLSTTCSPNPGVCHNSNNYPNLETAGNSLTWIGADCNTELPNPTDGWDACEKPGHVLVAGTAFTSGIAWVEPRGAGAWTMHLEDPAPTTVRTGVRFEDATGASFYDPPEVISDDPDDVFIVTVDLVAGSPDASLIVHTADAFERALADSILATIRGGDPNRNGIFGADAVPPGAVVVPGDLSRSYLWGRITGTVPGSRMPLANAPLTLPAYIAIACWIEGLDDTAAPPGADDPIDYDACTFADAPIDYTVQ